MNWCDGLAQPSAGRWGQQEGKCCLLGSWRLGSHKSKGWAYGPALSFAPREWGHSLLGHEATWACARLASTVRAVLLRSLSLQPRKEQGFPLFERHMHQTWPKHVPTGQSPKSALALPIPSEVTHTPPNATFHWFKQPTWRTGSAVPGLWNPPDSVYHTGLYGILRSCWLYQSKIQEHQHLLGDKAPRWLVCTLKYEKHCTTRPFLF